MESSSERSSSSSSVNDFRSFKPMYTLQPVKATRDKQLRQWSIIVMQHCTENKVSNINPSTFPLFSNDDLGRKLSTEGIAAVVENMIKAGNAEWENGPSHKFLRIFLKAPEVIANEIYLWASENMLLDTVATVYELYAGEDKDTAFYGTDVALIRKALVILEKLGKCKIMKGVTSEEDGVKFLAT